MAGEQEGKSHKESVTLNITLTITKQTLLLNELTQLTDRIESLEDDTLTIDYLHDKQIQANQIFFRAQENHAILLSILSEERQTELDYFKREVWKKVCDAFAAFEKLTDDKINALYKQRSSQRETQREVSMQQMLARDFDAHPRG